MKRWMCVALGGLVAVAVPSRAAEGTDLACGEDGKADSSALLQLVTNFQFRNPSDAESQRRPWPELAQLRSKGLPGPGGKGVFVAYLSAAKNADKRNQVRTQCLPSVKAKGWPYKFIVGRPNAPDGVSHRRQGSWASAEELVLAEELRQEQAVHQDLHMVPYLDHYADLTDKVTSLFDYGLDEGYDVLLKIDDDMCVSVPGAEKAAAVVNDTSAVYMGAYLWNGTEYMSMTGPTGEHPPYMGGPCYGLSRKLAGLVYREGDGFDTQLFASYGTDSEDNNMGRFYERLVEAHRNDTSVQFVRRLFPDMCYPVQQQ